MQTLLHKLFYGSSIQFSCKIIEMKGRSNMLKIQCLLHCRMIIITYLFINLHLIRLFILLFINFYISKAFFYNILCGKFRYIASSGKLHVSWFYGSYLEYCVSTISNFHRNAIIAYSFIDAFFAFIFDFFFVLTRKINY